MKKINLFVGMIAFLALTVSCETDQIDEPVKDEYQKSETFDAEATYYSILGDTESGMNQFDALTNSQKQNVWEFKYTRFKRDNSLNASQDEAVNDLLSYVKVADFSEADAVVEESLESDIRAAFDEETSNFLLLTLENDPSDIVSISCFWCRDEVSRTDCAPTFDTDGNFTGYAFNMNVRVRRF